MTISSKPAPDGVDITHESRVLHTQGKPISCILDGNPLNQSRYDSFDMNPELQAKLRPMVVETQDCGFVMILQLKIKSLDDFFEYTVLPNDEFIDVLITTREIVFVGPQLRSMFIISKLEIGDVLEMKQHLDKVRQQ